MKKIKIIVADNGKFNLENIAEIVKLNSDKYILFKKKKQLSTIKKINENIFIVEMEKDEDKIDIYINRNNLIEIQANHTHVIGNIFTYLYYFLIMDCELFNIYLEK